MRLTTSDTYIVISKTFLNNEDRKILHMLYQQLVGAMPISLYFTLWSYLDRNEIITSEILHQQLVINMGVTISEIEEARNRLEALGLIRTYYKEGNINNYVYELYSPLTAYEFFNDSILGTLLLNTVGKTEYERIINFFKVPRVSLDNYKDVTHTFLQVFEFASVSVIDKIIDNIKSKNSNGIIFNSEIDLHSIIDMIDDVYLNKKSITNDTRDLIKKISLMYNFDQDIIVELIKNSINEKKVIDKNILRTNACNYYKFENNNKVPSVIPVNRNYNVNNDIIDNTKKGKIISAFQNTSNYDFLKSKYKDGNPSKTDLKLIDYLAFDLNLNPGVINVLIDYVLRVNKNKLNRSYVETIAGQWKRNGIRSVSEAMDFASKEYKSKKNKTRKVNKVDKPEWFDQDINKSIATTEELKEIDSLLSNFK